jgi:hypothetical protein
VGNFSVTKISPGIFHVNFAKVGDLARTFLRFQEHYESPKFAGKVFTLKEFKAWYKKSRGKKRFTYYRDWDGFNIPASILVPFKDGSFDPLTEEESDFLQAVRDVPATGYIIGTAGNSEPSTLKHEIGHGFYLTNELYRLRVDDALGRIPKKQLSKIFAYLRELGYSEIVFMDEAHAYIMANLPYLVDDAGIRLTAELLDAHKTLCEIFDFYSAKGKIGQGR